MSKLGIVGTVLALGLGSAACDNGGQDLALREHEKRLEETAYFCKPVSLEIATDNENILAAFSDVEQAILCGVPGVTYELILRFRDKTGTRIYTSQ